MRTLKAAFSWVKDSPHPQEPEKLPVRLSRDETLSRDWDSKLYIGTRTPWSKSEKVRSQEQSPEVRLAAILRGGYVGWRERNRRFTPFAFKRVIPCSWWDRHLACLFQA